MKNAKVKTKLHQLYENIAELTKPKCTNKDGDGCRVPMQCCDPFQCEQVIAETGLARTTHPTLPLMGPNGCTAQPYQRPICAIHVCERNLWNAEFSEKYFDLREEISELEWHALK